MSDNYEKYKATIDEIHERTKDELWTMPFATLVLLLSALLGITLLVNLIFYSFGHWILAVLVYTLEIAALAYALVGYRRRVAETVRAKVSALEETHPEITAAYDEWRS